MRTAIYLMLIIQLFENTSVDFGNRIIGLIFTLWFIGSVMVDLFHTYESLIKE